MRSLDPLVRYIDEQFSTYLSQEKSLERRQLHDSRVHAVIYFVRPDSGLRPFDLIALRALGQRANVIPVIAKADTLTRDEMAHIKQRVRCV